MDIRGAPPGTGRLAVVVLHGRDQDPGWMYDEVVAWIEHRLPGLPLTWAAPAAPERTWYAGRVHDPPDTTRAERDRAADAVDAAAAALAEHGHGPSSTVLAGFSQGGCVVADHLLRRPRPWAGAVIWTGAAFGPSGTVWAPDPDALAAVPVLASNGEDDPWIPWSATASLAAPLRGRGAEVAERMVPGRGHEVADVEVDDAAALLARLTSPS